MFKQAGSTILAACAMSAALTFSNVGGAETGRPEMAPASAVEHDEPLPVPVSGEVLPESGGACIAADRILGVLALDVEHVGGEILALSGGLEQAFADSWRQTVGLPSVPVSQVFAHVVGREEGSGVVDVVEIDGQGCVLSRTLLAMEDWLFLLTPLRSVEV